MFRHKRFQRCSKVTANCIPKRFPRIQITPCRLTIINKAPSNFAESRTSLHDFQNQNTSPSPYEFQDKTQNSDERFFRIKKHPQTSSQKQKTSLGNFLKTIKSGQFARLQKRPWASPWNQTRSKDGFPESIHLRPIAHYKTAPKKNLNPKTSLDDQAIL